MFEAKKNNFFSTSFASDHPSPSHSNMPKGKKNQKKSKASGKDSPKKTTAAGKDTLKNGRNATSPDDTPTITMSLRSSKKPSNDEPTKKDSTDSTSITEVATDSPSTKVDTLPKRKKAPKKNVKNAKNNPKANLLHNPKKNDEKSRPLGPKKKRNSHSSGVFLSAHFMFFVFMHVFAKK